jgi:phosphoglycolate phosphatase
VILLFDLDGTVITFDGNAPGPGRTAMGRASQLLFGADHTVGVRFAGGTDKGIARAILERAQVGVSAENVDRILDTYVDELVQVLRERSYRAVGDVASAVRACSTRGAVVGVATGNTRRGAGIKLASAGLGDVFNLDYGGYGCDHELRAEVVRAGIRRCGGGDNVIVIGDTQQDVDAARAVGAKCVGVAVNQSTRDELTAAGADAIVSACGDELVEAIFTLR